MESNVCYCHLRRRVDEEGKVSCCSHGITRWWIVQEKVLKDWSEQVIIKGEAF